MCPETQNNTYKANFKTSDLAWPLKQVEFEPVWKVKEKKRKGMKAQFDIKFPPRMEGVVYTPGNKQAREASWGQEAGNCKWVWGSGRMWGTGKLSRVWQRAGGWGRGRGGSMGWVGWGCISQLAAGFGRGARHCCKALLFWVVFQLALTPKPCAGTRQRE